MSVCRDLVLFMSVFSYEFPASFTANVAPTRRSEDAAYDGGIWISSNRFRKVFYRPTSVRLLIRGELIWKLGL